MNELDDSARLTRGTGNDGILFYAGLEVSTKKLFLIGNDTRMLHICSCFFDSYYSSHLSDYIPGLLNIPSMP